MSLSLHDLLDETNDLLETLKSIKDTIVDKIRLKRKANLMSQPIALENVITPLSHTLFDDDGNEINISKKKCTNSNIVVFNMEDTEINKDDVERYLYIHRTELFPNTNYETRKKAIGPLITYLNRFLGYIIKEDKFVLIKYKQNGALQFTFFKNKNQLGKLNPRKAISLWVNSSSRKEYDEAFRQEQPPRMIPSDPLIYFNNLMKDKIRYDTLFSSPISLAGIYMDYLKQGHSIDNKPRDLYNILHTQLVDAFKYRQEYNNWAYKYTFASFEEVSAKWMSRVFL